jgi:hypothetical protein
LAATRSSSTGIFKGTYPCLSFSSIKSPKILVLPVFGLIASAECFVEGGFLAPLFVVESDAVGLPLDFGDLDDVNWPFFGVGGELLSGAACSSFLGSAAFSSPPQPASVHEAMTSEKTNSKCDAWRELRMCIRIL